MSKQRNSKRVETKKLLLFGLLDRSQAEHEVAEPIRSVSPVFEWKVSIIIDDAIPHRSRRQAIAQGHMEHARQSTERVRPVRIHEERKKEKIENNCSHFGSKN